MTCSVRYHIKIYLIEIKKHYNVYRNKFETIEYPLICVVNLHHNIVPLNIEISRNRENLHIS